MGKNILAGILGRVARLGNENTGPLVERDSQVTSNFLFVTILQTLDGA